MEWSKFWLIYLTRNFKIIFFFNFQMNQILTLRAEVKHLSTVAQQLEPYIKSLSGSMGQPKQAESQKIDNQQVFLNSGF